MLTDWLNTEWSRCSLVAETNLMVKASESEIWKMIFQMNGILKQSWVSVHMSDKVDFNLKLVNRDEDYSYILTKETIH
jgi:hypothetical protein